MNDNLIWTDGDTTIVEIAIGVVGEKLIPKKFELSQNYPNPFNPVTTIKYGLPVDSYVELRIFNLLGEEVARMVNQNQPAGFHEILWDASDVASGIYLYRIQSGDFVQTRKMVLLK